MKMKNGGRLTATHTVDSASRIGDDRLENDRGRAEKVVRRSNNGESKGAETPLA